MYRNILIATDGSELAKKAVEHGLVLAQAMSARATIVTVTESWEAASETWGVVELSYLDEQDPDRSPKETFDRAMEKRAEQILDPARSIARQLDVEHNTLHLREDFPAPAIISASEKLHSDLIVMGSHGRRGISRLVMGSQAAEVISTAKIPVLIVR